MSDTLHIGFVVEGPTDYCMLEETVATLLEGRDFVPHRLQPEMSEAFQAIPGEHGGGWPGVCRWCLQTAQQGGGQIRNSYPYDSNHLLIVQVDADVGEKSYADAQVRDPYPSEATLRCVDPCPPPSATTDRLRTLVLRWLGEESAPPRIVLCTPSKALETWILVALFPECNVVTRQDHIECRRHPEKTLRSRRGDRRLVSGNHKNVAKYRELAPEFGRNWARVPAACTEAERLAHEFGAALIALGTLDSHRP
ncbi:MAG: hypothetical protein AB1646_06375 [Thermodesulfobacteriota bacterium]